MRAVGKAVLPLLLTAIVPGCSGPAAVCRSDWTCVAAAAKVERQHDPDCVWCIHDAAWAELQLQKEALSPQLDGVDIHLRHAADELQRASRMQPRNRRYARDAAYAETFRRQFIDDSLPEYWRAVDGIAERDARINAVLAHFSLYGFHCRHALKDEYDAYVAYVGSLSSAAIRPRLETHKWTPFAARLFDVYVAARLREASADDELQTLQRITHDFTDTTYALAAENRFTATFERRLAEADNLRKLTAVCRYASNEAAHDRCEQTSHRMWAEQFTQTTDIHEKITICESLSGEEHADCRATLADAALAFLDAGVSRDSVAIARKYCTRPECNRRIYWRIAHQALQDLRYNGVGPDGRGTVVGESTDVWNAYIDLFDSMAKRTSDGRGSLKAWAPAEYRFADEMRKKAARSAEQQYVRSKVECEEALAGDNASPGASAGRIETLDRCVAELQNIVQRNQEDPRPQKLLLDVKVKYAELLHAPPVPSREVPWKRLGIYLGLSEAVRLIVPDQGAAVRWVRLLLWGVRF